MNGLLNILQMLTRILTRYERRQRDRAARARLRHFMETGRPATHDAANLEVGLTEDFTGRKPVVRNNCTFCGRERSPADDNHADDCPYWTIGPGRTDL